MNNEVNNESTVSPNNVTPNPIPQNPVDSNPVAQQPVSTPEVQPISSTPNNLGQVPINNTPLGSNPGTPQGPDSSNNIMNKVKSFGVVPIVIVAVVVVALIAGITTKVVTSSPKAVFKGQINTVFKAINQTIDGLDEIEEKFDIANNSVLLKGSLNLDTNVEDLGENTELLKKITMAGELGIDVDKEELYLSGSIKGDKNTVGINAYYQDEAAYLNATFLEDVVKVEDAEEIDFSEIKEALNMFKEQLEKNDTKTYTELVKKVNDSLNKSLDSKAMKKSNGKFEVDGKSVSATKNSLILDEDTLQTMVETFCNELIEDDEFLSDLANVTETDKGDIKEGLKEIKDTIKDVDMEDDIIINIWTKGLLNSCVGFSIEVDEKEYISYYVNDNNSELIINNHASDDYSKTKIVANFVKNKEEVEFTVKYNGEKVASGTIREMSEKLIDFDISVQSGDEEASVSVYITKNEDKKSINGEYKVKVSYNDEYISVSGTYEIATGDIPSVDTSSAVSIDEVDSEELIDNLKSATEGDSALDELFGDSINELEKESIDLNYYDMHPLTSDDEALAVLKKTKATVLYVGDTFYSSTSNLDARNMFENLQEAQMDLDFYSNYYPSYSVGDSFRDAVKDVNYTCKVSEPDSENSEEVCQEFPAIYLIKDGEVKKAFRGTVTEEELEDALKEIGIE